MDDLRERLDRIISEVDPDDPYGRTRMELVADRLLEDAVANLSESRKLLRQYQAQLSPFFTARSKRRYGTP